MQCTVGRATQQQDLLFRVLHGSHGQQKVLKLLDPEPHANKTCKVTVGNRRRNRISGGTSTCDDYDYDDDYD